MESIILTASVTGVEKSILAGARSAERALNLRPRIDTSGITRMSGPLGRINQQASEFNKSLEASNARVLAFGASAGAIYAVQRALAAVVRDAIEVEKILTDINSVLGQSSQKLADFSTKIFDAARTYGTSFKVAAEAALELSRQGLNAEATVKRLGASLLLARLGGMEAKDAVEGLTAAINSFNKEALDDVQVVNKLASVAAAFAVSEKDLTEALKRSASAASDAGVSFDELVALVTSAQQTTARGGAVIGNALKTIFTRIQRSDTLDQLKELGIAVRGVNGELLGAPDILKNLAKTYDTLGQEQKAFVSELVGGVFQINQLKAQLNDLSKDYGFYVRALKEANGATGEAIARNEELNKTTAAMLNKISVSITEISSSIGGEMFRPVIQTIDTWFSEVFEFFSAKGEDSGLNFGKMFVKGIGSALSGPGLVLALAAVTALTLKLGGFAIGAAKSILDIVGGLDRQRQIQTQIQAILAESGRSYADIIRGATSVEQIEKRILAIVRERLALQNSANSLTANIAPAQSTVFGNQRAKLQAAGLNYTGGKVTLGRGPFPGFADPIEAAVKREKAAGVPASQIYIDRDPRVKSPGNPLGILVANKRDEPMGGFQGVNRALAMGIDPKKHGGGFVPNFAEFDTLSRSTGMFGKVKDVFGNVTHLSGDEKILASEAKQLRSLASKIRNAVSAEDFTNAAKAFTDYAKTLNLTSNGLVKVNTVVQNAGAKMARTIAAREEEAKIATELAFIQAKRQEEASKVYAKQFESESKKLPKAIIPPVPTSEPQKPLSFDEKAKQMGWVKSQSSSSGLSEADFAAYESYAKEQVKVDRALRKYAEKKSKEIQKKQASYQMYKSPIGPEFDYSMYSSPVGPKIQPRIIRHNANVPKTQEEYNAMLAAEQTIGGSSIASTQQVLRGLQPSLFRGKNQFTGKKLPRFPRETYLEKDIGLDLTNVGFGGLGAITGQNITTQKQRAEGIYDTRKALNVFRRTPVIEGGGVNKDFLDLVGSITRQESLQDKFVKDVEKSLTGPGAVSFESAIELASEEFVKNGGSNKQLRDVITNNVKSFADLEKSVTDTKKANREMISKIAKSNDAETAFERERGNLNKLTKEQRKIIREKITEQAKQKLGFGGMSNADIAYSDPLAMKQLNEEIGNSYKAIRENLRASRNVKNAQDFDKVLTETFDQRSGFRLGAFGTKKGDLKLLQSKLGNRKLTAEEMLAFEARQGQLQSERRGRMTGYGIGASFLLSAAVGSGALEGMFGDTQGSRLAGGGLQGAATGATLGSFAGLPGIIAGTAIGGGLGLIVSAGKEAEVVLQKTAEAYKNLSAELNNNVQNVQNYANTQQQLNDLIKSGTAKEQDITNLNNQLSTLFNSITDQKARNDILNAAGNIDALNAALDSLARKNGERLAKESIGVAVAFANQNKAGTTNLLGAKFGGVVKTADLEKIGQAVAAASNITNEELDKLKNSFDALNKGSDIKAVSEALKNLGVEASGIDTDVRGLLVVLKSFIDNKSLSKAFDERQKIESKYLLQLQEYNSQFKNLVTSIIEQGQLAEMQRLADREIQVAGAEQRSRMLGGTQLSIFDRDANISRMKLAFSNESQVSQLNQGVAGKIRDFAAQNLSETYNKEEFLGAIRGKNPSEQLEMLLNLGKNSFKDQVAARKELETMLREYRYSVDQLSIEQNKQIQLLEQSVQIEREMLKKADLSRTFGGAGNFGQPINTEILRSGFRAGAAVGISDRALASRRYIAREDRYAMEKAAMPDRLTAAKGLIEMAQMLPEGVNGLRTAENFEIVRAATEEDLRGKNNQALLASIQGFFEGQEKLGGAFGPGGPSAGMGRDYRDRIMTLLTQSNGGRDLSGLQKFVNSSQLGVRSPEALRQLKTIVDSFAQNAKTLPEAAKAIAENLFPLGKKDSVAEKSLTELKAIATSTADTKSSVDELIEVFKLQQGVVNAGAIVKEKGSAVEEFKSKKKIAEQSAQQIRGQSIITLETTLFSERVEKILKKIIGADDIGNIRASSPFREAFSKIKTGKTVGQAFVDIRGTESYDKFGQMLGGASVAEQDEKIKNFLLEFADESDKQKYRKRIEEISPLDSKIRAARGEVWLSRMDEKAAEQTLTQNLRKKEEDKLVDAMKGLSNIRSAISAGSYSSREADIAMKKAQQKVAEQLKIFIDKDQTLVAAALFGEKFKEIIQSSATEVKTKVEQEIKTSMSMVVKDMRVSPEEIEKLKKEIEELSKKYAKIENKDKSANGENTTPATTPNASGARR